MKILNQLLTLVLFLGLLFVSCSRDELNELSPYGNGSLKPGDETYQSTDNGKGGGSGNLDDEETGIDPDEDEDDDDGGGADDYHNVVSSASVQITKPA